MNLKDYIANVEGFPKEGIIFRDITPLMADGKAFKYATSKLTEFAKNKGATLIVGPEARGFIFGCPVAVDLEVGFIPVRKPGKLPRETVSEKYDLEYGTDILEIHTDAIHKGENILIHDDVLATGGTMKAVTEIVEQLGGNIVQINFLIELDFLNGREKIKDREIYSILNY